MRPLNLFALGLNVTAGAFSAFVGVKCMASGNLLGALLQAALIGLNAVCVLANITAMKRAA